MNWDGVPVVGATLLLEHGSAIYREVSPSPMFRTILATTIALVAIAAPASASPHTLNIESATTTTFNTPTLFYVYGTDAPPSDLGGDFWIEIVDLPGEIVPACPFGHQDALGFAENLPGQILDISLQPDRAVERRLLQPDHLPAADAAPQPDLRLHA